MSQTYYLPDSPYEDWRGSEAGGYRPSPRQQALLDVYASAKRTGLFYTSDIVAFASTKLGVSAELLARCTTNVDGGDFAYDVYFAGKCFGAMQRYESVKRAAADLCHLQKGMQLGTLVFNDHKRCTNVCVHESNSPESIVLKGKRGSSVVGMETDALSIKHAIERAASKGLRKDTFEALSSSLRPGQGSVKELKARCSLLDESQSALF